MVQDQEIEIEEREEIEGIEEIVEKDKEVIMEQVVIIRVDIKVLIQEILEVVIIPST